jgi:hypothetical protein
MVERLEERANEAALGKGVELDIAPWLNFTAFDIFGDLGFGESFNCLEHSQYHPWIALLFNSVKAASFVAAARFYPLVEWVLMRCIPPSLSKMQQDHYQQIVDKVDRRLNWEVERPDIMSYVIQQCFDGKGLSTGEINATFMVLTTAGSETTATTLCGAVNYLAAHPDKRFRLATEIRATFQNREEISLDVLKDLPYLNAVLQETLRLCPAIPWLLPRRVPAGGDTVCGTWLPGGVSWILYFPVWRVTNHGLSRHRYPSKHGPSIETRTIFTMPPHSNRSDGSLILLLTPPLLTTTIGDRLFSHSASAHATAWANIWHGLKCA